MKIIEVDDDLYQFIASQTQHIGESASDILRRLLQVDKSNISESVTAAEPTAVQEPEAVIEEETPQQSIANITPIDAQQLPSAEILAAQKGAVGRFLLILSALHHQFSDNFNVVNDIRGRDRLYFATSKEQLLAAGSSTNPKSIEGSEYWVVTNNNTHKKRAILIEVCERLGLDADIKERLTKSL
ncbi:replication initiation negative regulator SeqA [Echinimonas agarilytica]|uniref:Negative modulator of initiation of replication n=1 Tax=Echinimonas agarilytica TaxID=1215918 RepID=A0AA41W909_9GAMM|nr:replication initiation negative regulator SeqA [Echinimonas agarilytica]MCM2680792.1 replication initiation negative regulator SeqA [Echinimonas agarilytica]